MLYGCAVMERLAIGAYLSCNDLKLVLGAHETPVRHPREMRWLLRGVQGAFLSFQTI